MPGDGVQTLGGGVTMGGGTWALEDAISFAIDRWSLVPEVKRRATRHLNENNRQATSMNEEDYINRPLSCICTPVNA